jgi:hypothetical protein
MGNRRPRPGASLVEGGTVASEPSGYTTRDRLPGIVLAALVVLVQLVWGGMLVYLGFHFL